MTSARSTCRPKSSTSLRRSTNAEWDVMRTHPQVGYDLVRKLPQFARAAEIVLAHHEAFDGSGLPTRSQRG